MFPDHLHTTAPRFVSATARAVERVVQPVAFWTATILPMGYLPLLLVAPARFTSLSILGQLVSLNVLALVVGHGYHNGETDGRED